MGAKRKTSLARSGGPWSSSRCLAGSRRPRAKSPLGEVRRLAWDRRGNPNGYGYGNRNGNVYGFLKHQE
jgi:hypothetical protein